MELCDRLFAEGVVSNLKRKKRIAFLRTI